jgi:DNA-binding SARP family transcriptional activator
VPGLRIELLGRFRVSVADREVDDAAWHRRKSAALVKLLALAPAHRLHRERLMDALWPGLPPSAAAANLRKALHQVRRALDPLTGAHLVGSDADSLWLSSDQLWVDVDAFRSTITAARRTGDVGGYRRALEIYREGLLPDDAYAEWAAEPRDELHHDHVAALEELAALLEARAELDTAVEVARRLVAAEPLREESHVVLMRLQALAGRRGEALRTYDQLRALLDRELGTPPAPQTQRLAGEIRARQRLDPELTAQLWERVGDLRTLSGDALGAAKAYALAVDTVPEPGAVGRLERKCAEAWLMQHRPDAAAAHLAAAAAAAVQRAEAGRLLRARANHAWECGDLAAAQRYAEQARAAARRHGTAADLAAAEETLAIVSHLRGDWRGGLESELGRLASEGIDSAQLARVFDIHHCIGQYHLYGDGLAGSVEGYARRILDRAEHLDAARAQAFAWCLLGESLLLQARWDEAMGCLARSCQLHASFGSRSGALAWQRRAELAVCTGSYGEAAGYLREAAAIATVSPMAQHMWGRIHATAAFAAVEQHDPQRAARSVGAAAAAAARYGDCPTCSALLNPIAAEACALLADADSARGYAGSAARVAEMFQSSAWRAMAESAAASVAIAARGGHAATRHLQQAASLYELAGQPYWAARCRRLAAAGNAEGTGGA